MTDHAIVIGIDRYDNPAWELRAAVRDALEFAAWVTEPGAGRATPETTTVHLSPRDGTQVDVPFLPATFEEIGATLKRYYKAEGAGATRLWFFYSGHGHQPPGGGPAAEPYMVVSNTDPDFAAAPELAKAIGLGLAIGRLAVQAPATQYYFVDACRGIASESSGLVATSQLVVDLAKLRRDGATFAGQGLLLATTAGRPAVEQGLHGVFSRALLAGLRGQGPTLQPRLGGFDLTWAGLVDHVTDQVEREMSPARQRPYPDTAGMSGNEALVQFADAPKVTLRVMVEPKKASQLATAAIISRDPLTGDVTPRLQHSPPLGPEGASWELLRNTYGVQVLAAGYEPWVESVTLQGDLVQVAQMEAVMPDPFESVGPRPSETARRDWSNIAGSARLTVRSDDPLTRIEVFDEAGRRLAAGRGQIDLDGLDPGLYRVESTQPGHSTVHREILLPPDRTTVSLDTDQPLPELLAQALEAADISVDRSTSQASEVFGWPTTNVGSLLAWSAWAARFDPGGYGHRLRSLGVDHPTGGDGSGSHLQVLVGSPSDVSWAEEFSVAVGPAGAEQVVDSNQVAGMAGLGRQWQHLFEAHGSVVFEGPDVGRISLPVPVIPGFGHVVVVAAEAGGGREIHRYLLPNDPHDSFSDWIRLQELNWRGLQEGRPFLPGEEERLYQDPYFDPLTEAIVGFRLLAEGRGELIPPPTMGTGLPDLEVLRHAGGFESVDITGIGTPLLEPAYLHLLELRRQQAAALNAPPPVEERPIVRGTAWTLLDAGEKGPRLSDGVLVTSEIEALNPTWYHSIADVVAATARIESGSAQGTGFLVAPRLLAVPAFAMAGGRSTASVVDDAVAWFEAGSRPIALAVVAVDEGAASAGNMILVELAEPPAVDPVVLSDGRPAPWDRVGIIGHPMPDPRVAVDAIESAFGSLPTGEKTLVTGTVHRIDGSEFHYEAFTLAGMAGGPVVDLDSGEVIGVHIGGRFDGEAGIKHGFGLDLTTLRNLLGRM